MHARQRDGQHDERRRRVWNQHRKQRRRRHHRKQQRPRARAAAADDGERDAPVQPRAFDGKRDERSAEQQEQHRRIIFGGDRVGRHDAHERRQDEGQERRRGDR